MHTRPLSASDYINYNTTQKIVHLLYLHLPLVQKRIDEPTNRRTDEQIEDVVVFIREQISGRSNK